MFSKGIFKVFSLRQSLYLWVSVRYEGATVTVLHLMMDNPVLVKWLSLLLCPVLNAVDHRLIYSLDPPPDFIVALYTIDSVRGQIPAPSLKFGHIFGE